MENQLRLLMKGFTNKDICHGLDLINSQGTLSVVFNHVTYHVLYHFLENLKEYLNTKIKGIHVNTNSFGKLCHVR